jgi:hypothetical protein
MLDVVGLNASAGSICLRAFEEAQRGTSLERNHPSVQARDFSGFSAFPECH